MGDIQEDEMCERSLMDEWRWMRWMRWMLGESALKYCMDEMDEWLKEMGRWLREVKKKIWHQNDEVVMDEGGVSGVKMRKKRKKRRRRRKMRRIYIWNE